jgi:hypothetical protein
METPAITVRVDKQQLAKLNAIGKSWKPPLNQSKMVNMAIEEFVKQHADDDRPRKRASKRRAK